MLSDLLLALEAAEVCSRVMPFGSTPVGARPKKGARSELAPSCDAAAVSVCCGSFD